MGIKMDMVYVVRYMGTKYCRGDMKHRGMLGVTGKFVGSRNPGIDVDH